MDVIHNPRERVDPSEEMPSREEEERYRKLLSENDELQRLIAEVTINISPIKILVRITKSQGLMIIANT